MSTRKFIISVIAAVMLKGVCLASVPFCPDLSPNDRVDFADFALLASNWHQMGISLKGDFSGNGTVDIYDFAQLADNWLQCYECKSADFHLDYKINFLDYAKFASEWLSDSSTPGWDAQYDLDSSNMIDFTDVTLLTNRWLKTYPEPNDNFEAFKSALASGNIQTALTFVAEDSQTKYSEIFQAMGTNLSNFAAGMGNLTWVSQDEGRAVYEMTHQDGPETYKFPVVFVKDDEGYWKIYNF